MRIIGEIPHPVYKISVLKMNEKVTIQIEDRLVSQSYAFRDGTGIRDKVTAENYLTEEFMNGVSERFKKMNEAYIKGLEKLNANEIDDFEII